MYSHTEESCDKERPESSYRCRGCGVRGHRQANCPKIECRNCKQLGHMAENCPTSPVVQCYRCKQEGHAKIECKAVIAREYIHTFRSTGAAPIVPVNGPYGISPTENQTIFELGRLAFKYLKLVRLALQKSA
jgi:hypothetical protein